MNDINFCDSFSYNMFRFMNYHVSDYSKKPITRHYFGCLVRGTACIRANDQVLQLQPGEIFYIPKGLQYQSQWFGDGESKKIEFYSFGFQLAPSKTSYILQKVPCDQKAGELFSELCTQIPFAEKSIGMLYRFFGEVAPHMRQAPMSHGNSLVMQATQYILKHPGAKISQVAEHCHMSQASIYTNFKKHTGKTPNEVRLQVLCQQAVSLLTTTDRSVQEISDTLGFSSTSYFRKILRKQTGKTPLQLRKESVL